MKSLHIKLFLLIIFFLLVNFVIFTFYVIKFDDNYNDLKQHINSLQKKLSINNTLLKRTTIHIKPIHTQAKKIINTNLSNFIFDSNKYFGSSKSSPVFIIEFSNFKCGYCARHKKSVFKQIKKNYIDTNKIKYYVFNTTNANDKNSIIFSKLYYCNTSPIRLDEFINELFSLAKKNYQNIDKINVDYLAKFSADKEEYLTCINDKKLNNNILTLNKDLSSLDITKTPTFLIGRFSNKKKYKRLIGALPYNVFVSEIERLLNDETN